MIDIQSEILKIHSLQLLDSLLEDKSTGNNILWAADAYAAKGLAYERNQEIKAELITGENSGIIKYRAQKKPEHQAKRTRQHAEVFTPLRICREMIDTADEGCGLSAGRWKEYVDLRRLEITCGEAPYLVSRYDASDGESVPLPDRAGILDRKLKAVSDNADSEDEWLKWAVRAYQATYGYEFQGDNLLTARVNMLMTFEEYLENRWKRKPTLSEYRIISEIISWNLWQMDGLSCAVPYLSDCEGCAADENKEPPLCVIFDWKSGRKFPFSEAGSGKDGSFRFDFVVGNPPYQGKELANGRPAPIYNRFMEASYKLADRVELITPARFLFDAGLTPKAWNKKMLSDENFRVLHYFENAAEIFPNTEIKGGVAISYRDLTVKSKPIEVFTAHPELKDIAARVRARSGFIGLDTVVSVRGMYRLRDEFFEDAPFAKERLGKGTGNMLVSNILEKIPEMFTEMPINADDLIVNGRVKNERIKRYIKRAYVIRNDFTDTYNIMIPKSNGSGIFGEKLTMPIILSPGEIATDTFMSIGLFPSRQEAEYMIKYYCTKFFRALLGMKKATQDNPQSVWKAIPLLNFSDCDIDWSKSVHEIDCQLYSLYGLTDKEIRFIESGVKEMDCKDDCWRKD